MVRCVISKVRICVDKRHFPLKVMTRRSEAKRKRFSLELRERDTETSSEEENCPWLRLNYLFRDWRDQFTSLVRWDRGDSDCAFGWRAALCNPMNILHDEQRWLPSYWSAIWYEKMSSLVSLQGNALVLPGIVLQWEEKRWTLPTRLRRITRRLH